MSKSAGTIQFTEESTFVDIDDIEKGLITLSSQVVDSWERIVVLDYAFSNIDNVQQSVEEFISVQDRLLTRGIRNVRLNYITVNSDMYHQIKQGVGGYDGIIYDNTEIFLVYSGITISTVMKVLQGEMDGRGYAIERPKELGRIEQYEKTKRELEEDIRTVSDKVLEYEKDIPASKLSKTDYVDLPESEKVQQAYWLKQLEEKEAQEAEEEHEEEVRKAPKINLYTPNPRAKEPEIRPKERTGIDTFRQESQAQKMYQSPQEKRGILTAKDYKEQVQQVNRQRQQAHLNKKPEGAIEELRYLYNQLAQDSNTVTDSKLLSDKGSIIGVTGMEHGGASGVLAQMAEVYAMIGLKVLVLDLDVVKRMQTVYFSNFDTKIIEGNGLSNGLLNVASGGDIKKASVPVTSRIYVCGLSRGFAQVDSGTIKSIAYSLEEILKEALHQFDIILIDIPFKNLVDYQHQLNAINRYILVLDNKFYEMEHFLEVELTSLVESNHLLMGELLKRFSVIVNQMRVNTRDYEGYRIDQTYVKTLLQKVGNPYDAIFVAGELPFYDDWERQFLTNKRYIWDSDSYLGLIKNILRKAV